MTPHDTPPLFDQHGAYRREALRLQREGRLQSFALACVAGLCISAIAAICWMIAAGL